MPALSERTETILVVDDNEAVLNVMVAILQSADFRVLAAESGAAALKLADETDHKIDLLISDVEMPQMSGPDLCERMKKTRAEMQVMLMSGGAKGSWHSGWAYIRKPLNAQKLIEIVTKALRPDSRRD